MPSKAMSRRSRECLRGSRPKRRELRVRHRAREGKDAAECCGIGLQKGATWNHSFRVTSQDGTFVEQLTRVVHDILALVHQAGTTGVQTGHGAAGRTHPTTRHRSSGRRVQGLPVVQILGEGLVAQAVHGTLADQILCKFRASFGGSTRPHAGRDGPAPCGTHEAKKKTAGSFEGGLKSREETPKEGMNGRTRSSSLSCCVAQKQLY